MEIFTHEKLQVWQKSRVLVKDVYILIGQFPQTEKFGLGTQLGRAIVSVASNIAEGCGRPSLKERAHCYEIAYGSLMESLTQLTLAADLGMIKNEDVENLKPEFGNIARMLSGLRNNIQQRLSQGG